MNGLELKRQRAVCVGLMHHSAVITARCYIFETCGGPGIPRGTENTRLAVFLQCVQYTIYSAVGTRKICFDKTRTPSHAKSPKIWRNMYRHWEPWIVYYNYVLLFGSNIQEQTVICWSRGAQNPSATSPWSVHFVWWRLIQWHSFITS